MRLAAMLVLAALPRLAAAGTTLHYSGTLKAPSEAARVVADAVSFAKEKGWSHQADEEGAVLFPHPWCEPVELRFEGRELAASWVKTQFAGADVHVAIVDLFRKLEPRFERLAVSDEGEYWERRDRALLEKNLRANDAAIAAIRKDHPGARGPLRLEGGRIVDLVSGSDPSVLGDSAPPAAPVVAPSGWKRVEASDAGFTALFPGEPERAAMTRDGARVVFYAWADPAGGRHLAVTTTFWDRDVPGEVVAWAADRFVETQGGRVVSRRPYLGNRYQGAAIELERDGARLVARVAATGRRVYQLLATTEGTASFAPAELRAFFDSFTPRAAEPAPAAAPAPAAPPRKVPPAARAQGWRKVVARDEGFEIAFPGAPTREVDERSASVLHSVAGQGAAPSFAVQTFAAATAENAAESASGFADAVAAQFPGAVVRDEETKLGGLRARSLAVASGEMRIELRFVASGKRVHRLAVGASGAEPHPDDARRFFESFRPAPDGADRRD